ncbi:MAG: NAD(P)-dependent oxidoreductase, partial [Burkholderiales bacterium]
VTSSMPHAPWQHRITRAFTEPVLAADFVPSEGRHGSGVLYALVWLPPAQLFEVERDLEVVFNLGAGGERLLADAVVPERLPIVRLVDAGMAARIAEYVCFAIARTTRGLERFRPRGLRDWDASRPRGKPPTVGVLGAGAIGSKIAEAAARFGYPVRQWSRTLRTLADVESFAGLEQLNVFLSGSNFLVNALRAHARHREPARPRAFVKAATQRTRDQRRAWRNDRQR